MPGTQLAGALMSAVMSPPDWPEAEITVVRMIKISPSLSTDSRPDHSRQLTCSPNSHCLISQAVCETGVWSSPLSEETTLRVDMEHRQRGRAGQTGRGAPAQAVGSRACGFLRREPPARPACLHRVRQTSQFSQGGGAAPGAPGGSWQNT